MAYQDFSPVAGEGVWPKLKLTTAHIQPWEETRAASLWALPYITDVWYAMMIDRDGTTAWFTDQIKTCATDDKYMYINPTFLFAKPLEERVFICAHEVLHCIFNHCGLMYHCEKEGCVKYPDGDVLPYNRRLMNIAMDCLINVMLVESDVGGMPKDAWYLPYLVKSDTNALEAYRTLYNHWKRPPLPPGVCINPGTKPGDNNNDLIEIPDNEKGKSFDTHLKPGGGTGKSPSEAIAERNDQEWEDAVNAAMQSARAAGRLPDSMEKVFKISMEVETRWEDEITVSISSAVGREGHSWSYLDGEFAMRGIGFPGRVRYGCKRMIVVIDSSGSIYYNQTTVNMFLSNLAVIISQLHPKELIFGECDAAIHRWESITDMADLQGKVLGGGGTSFRPPFKRVEEDGSEPDVLVYFTDLDSWDGFPDDPGYPVIWASTDASKKAPWGKNIYVPPLKANPETL